MHPQSRAVLDALTALPYERPPGAVGISKFSWAIPADRETVRENACETTITVTYRDADPVQTPDGNLLYQGRETTVTVPGSVTMLQAVRGLHEFAAGRGLASGINAGVLAVVLGQEVALDALVKVMKERTE